MQVLLIGATVLGMLFGAVIVWLPMHRRLEQEERAHVQVGDLWQYVGEGRWTPGVFEVIKANVNTEAGADSWVMKNHESGKTAYMHHRQRANLDWILCMRAGKVMRRAEDIEHEARRKAEYST